MLTSENWFEKNSVIYSNEVLETFFYRDLFVGQQKELINKSQVWTFYIELNFQAFKRGFAYNVLYNAQSRAEWHWPVYFFYLNNTNATAALLEHG